MNALSEKQWREITARIDRSSLTITLNNYVMQAITFSN